MLIDQEIASRYEARETAYDKAIEALVKGLPVWIDHFSGVKGIGAKGVGLMIGLGSDPAERPNAGKYRKRLGICPKEEYEKSERTGAYMRPNRKKAMILWEIIDSAIRAGPYAELYQERREFVAMAHPELVNVESSEKQGKLVLTKYGDNKTRFKVASRFVCDFWGAWMETAPA